MHEQVLVGAEVVVDETVVDAGLLGEAPRRDTRIADLDQEPLGRVEERFLRRRTSRGLAEDLAHRGQ
jgi:hypothetical protein